eukprot:scaffold4802_cov96-Skeletonema_dohrnii-CCMP3373.AAC.5
MIARLFVLLGDTKDITCCACRGRGKLQAAGIVSRAAVANDKKRFAFDFWIFRAPSSRGEH